ncbi:flagella basal body P-ring formation protein FlgA [Lacisediminimonas profundi]|uniref:flagella basal body P-ring formation protein FlgA n=1 Tax=Lacisediminimonas profundi TaxID=2603856 RepID=UPI001386F8FD|nr:flagella basal body P-ring formation protein FlgA [Lacisediminimonas profundi]
MIHLRDSATVTQREVKVIDVAGVEATDAALRKIIEATTLALIGSRREPLRLSRERVKHALERRLPALRDAMTLAGADAVLLTSVLSDEHRRSRAVEHGSEVLVRVTQGGVTIEDRATSLGSGATGSQVRVRNPRSKQEYLVTVLGNGVAEAR